MVLLPRRPNGSSHNVLYLPLVDLLRAVLPYDVIGVVRCASSASTSRTAAHGIWTVHPDPSMSLRGSPTSTIAVVVLNLVHLQQMALKSGKTASLLLRLRTGALGLAKMAAAGIRRGELRKSVAVWRIEDSRVAR